MLTKYDPKTNYLEGTCSGTYLNKNIFLTAAHCIDILSAGEFSDQTYQYAIDCPGVSDWRHVKGAVVHPYFFLNDEDFVNFNEKLLNSKYLISSQNGFSKIDYNDMALLYTEPVSFSKYPTLNAKNDVSSKDCSFLGFSTEYCSSDNNGVGCYRKLTLKKTAYNNLYEDGCNLVTGEGCYLNSKEKENYPIYLQANIFKFSYGDSGSGIVCKENDKDVLVGILNRMNDDNPILSVAHKIDFIKQFINLNEKEFIERSKNFILDPNYRLVLQKAEEIKKKSSILYLFTGISGYAILNDFENWLLLDEKYVNDLLEEKNIITIRIYYSKPNLFGFLETPYLSEIKGHGMQLNIGTSAKINDVIKVLTEK